MLEFLVFAACVSGPGCNKATEAYYNYNVDLQVWAKRSQKKVENEVGKTNLAVLGTLTGILVVKQGSIQVSNHVNLLVGQETQLQLHWSM